MYQDGTNDFCWYFPTYYIDDLDPPESGRKQIKFWFIVYLFMSSFGTMEICSYGSWTNYLIPIIEYVLLTF